MCLWVVCNVLRHNSTNTTVDMTATIAAIVLTIGLPKAMRLSVRDAPSNIMKPLKRYNSRRVASLESKSGTRWLHAGRERKNLEFRVLPQVRSGVPWCFGPFRSTYRELDEFLYSGIDRSIVPSTPSFFYVKFPQLWLGAT